MRVRGSGCSPGLGRVANRPVATAGGAVRNGIDPRVAVQDLPSIHAVDGADAAVPSRSLHSGTSWIFTTPDQIGTMICLGGFVPSRLVPALVKEVEETTQVVRVPDPRGHARGKHVRGVEEHVQADVVRERRGHEEWRADGDTCRPSPPGPSVKDQPRWYPRQIDAIDVPLDPVESPALLSLVHTPERSPERDVCKHRTRGKHPLKPGHQSLSVRGLRRRGRGVHLPALGDPAIRGEALRADP